MDLRRTILLAGAMLGTMACAQTSVNTAVARADGFHPATVLAVAGSVWAAQYASSEPRSAWSLPAQGAVQDLRISPNGEHGGFAVRFRQGGASWEGRLDEDLHATGDLAQVRDTASAPIASNQ